jgi:hypothetical protein
MQGDGNSFFAFRRIGREFELGRLKALDGADVLEGQVAFKVAPGKQ